MYDWANSVYNLVITTTFFPIYFAGIMDDTYGADKIPFMGRMFKSTSLYDYSLAFAYLAIALLLPILSSIAVTPGETRKCSCNSSVTWVDSPASVSSGLIKRIPALRGGGGGGDWYVLYWRPLDM